jgi:hypothetical protein
MSCYAYTNKVVKKTQMPFLNLIVTLKFIDVILKHLCCGNVAKNHISSGQILGYKILKRSRIIFTISMNLLYSFPFSSRKTMS